MIDLVLKQELKKAANELKEEYEIKDSQGNIEELQHLFRKTSYLEILFIILSCFNQRVKEGTANTAEYEMMKAKVQYLESVNQQLREKLDQQNKMISSYNGLYANRAKVAAGISKPAYKKGTEPEVVLKYFRAGFRPKQIAYELDCDVRTIQRRLYELKEKHLI